MHVIKTLVQITLQYLYCGYKKKKNPGFLINSDVDFNWAQIILVNCHSDTSRVLPSFGNKLVICVHTNTDKRKTQAA